MKTKLFLPIILMMFIFASCEKENLPCPSGSGNGTTVVVTTTNGQLNGQFVVISDPGYMNVQAAQQVGYGDPIAVSNAQNGPMIGNVYCKPDASGCDKQTQISNDYRNYGYAIVTVVDGWVTGVSY